MLFQYLENPLKRERLSSVFKQEHLEHRVFPFRDGFSVNMACTQRSYLHDYQVIFICCWLVSFSWIIFFLIFLFFFYFARLYCATPNHTTLRAVVNRFVCLFWHHLYTILISWSLLTHLTDDPSTWQRHGVFESATLGWNTSWMCQAPCHHQQPGCIPGHGCWISLIWGSCVRIQTSIWSHVLINGWKQLRVPVASVHTKV